ncbi:UDP-N-acetylglucosamine 2-epimerase (non-hydrolyzing) [Cryomorpha ignava]|uniref:UDP-N-acetylglucosamine 2-epimerase (Non-hydrolyzing) n=1 Tax=Cryomorpha ignava TaxID=101383 RepID=A0A7K3WM43_9FLAO|nr:UDP-N-acetylglucosamine 2-epimerase (non-hydrolyzing) [Cryomorpha ignava]NEN22716.1 UDP-N-acetylglucosamine 2-epimerase (non-hydrolyzing) [Cryomorpha ignava]
MIKLLTVIGARPQFIKSAAISRAISKSFSNKIEEVIVHTGQHYDPEMSNIFFDELNIPKEKYNLKIGSSNHAHQTAKIMIALDEVVEKEMPNAILLYGDTNSTLAACLVGVKRHIPVIHVEAGVRSFNKLFPEEVNRLICDHVSSLLFVPSDDGILSLQKEGFTTAETEPEDNLLLNHPKVYRCGDIMYDNTLYFKDKAESYFKALIDKYHLPESNFFLITAHRPSNVDNLENFKAILSFLHYAIDSLGKEIIFPIHPRTRKLIDQNQELSGMIDAKGIHCMPPISFIEMIGLEKNADLIVTDSGGVQKEAFFMKKPCLIMLEETPWVELVESKNAKLVGSDYDLLCQGAKYFLENKPQHFESIYGDGKSAHFICEKIIENIKK